MIAAVVNHLWQSTLFAAAAGLLTLALRKNHAGARYGLWLAASVKFLVPFSLLVAMGSHVTWRTGATPVAPRLAVALEQASQPFVAPAPILPKVRGATPDPMPRVLLVAWAFGCAVVLLCWLQRWRRARAVLRAAAPVPIAAPVAIKSSSSLLEPGVFGIFRPVLLLPEGIGERLEPEQLQAILAHEWTHVRRRDNLAAAMHMVVEALFWFHPLVWWIGARLVEERERACDEAVFSEGHDPEVYAAGILRVCRFYLESPLPCVAGVTGADLRKRIERIMTRRVARRLDAGKKLLLAVAGVAAVALPIGFGLMRAPAARAQAGQSRPAFEVASVKPGDPKDPDFGVMVHNGRFTATNATLKQLIAFAYDVRSNQISGGPKWLDSDKFSIDAKRDGASLIPMTARPQMRVMLQSLLEDRFQLVLRRETKENPVHELVVAKGGPKIKQTGDTEQHSQVRIGPASLSGTAAPLSALVDLLSQRLGRSVIDKTGLTGAYDFMLEWVPDGSELRSSGDAPGTPPPAASDGPSIFTALQEQLGLKLESAKGSVAMLAIERAEKPAEN